METQPKRKANSPCESYKLKSTRVISPVNSTGKTTGSVSSDASIESSVSSELNASVFFSPRSEIIDESDEMSETNMEDEMVKTVSYTVENKNGERFRGALDRPEGYPTVGKRH